MIILGVMSLALLSLTPAWAGDGALDLSFNPGVGVQKIPIIRGQAEYLNSGGTATTGVSLIFGYFTSINDSAGPHNISSIAKLNDTSGTVDTSFNIPIVGDVRSALLLNPSSSTSPIIIGGNFSLTSGSTTYYNLARLSWTGSAYAVDTTFPQIFNLVDTGEGIPVSAVNAVAVQGSSGKILVGGFNLQVLTSAGGDSTTAYHLIRLNSDWTYDSAYSTANPARALPGGYVNGISISTTSNQARIFGTLPRTNSQGTPPYNDYMQLLDTNLSSIVQHLGDDQLDGPLFSMARSTSGAPWVICGNFKTAFTTAINRVAVLKSDLSGLDNTTAPYASFNSGIITGGGADHSVQQVMIQGTDQVVLGGSLTAFNGTSCGHLVRLNTNGTVDTSFNNPGTPGTGADDRTFKLYQPLNQDYYQILGAFRNYNGTGTPRGGIASIDLNGNLLGNYASVTANSSTPGTVHAVESTSQGDGSIIIGGDFTGVGGKYHQNLAKLNWNGSTDHSFISNVEGVVNSLRSRDARLLVAGNFGTANGVGRTSVARLNTDYSLDTTFFPVVTKSNGTLGGIHSTDQDDSGSIMIMGHFDMVNASARSAIARLFSTGDLDTEFTFNPGSMQDLSNIRVNAGGNMGGLYPMVGKATYQGSTHGFGARLLHNGALDTSFATGQSPVPNVVLFDGEAINGRDLPGGQLLLCGNFTHIIGTQSSIPRGYIARFTANGLLDTTWAPEGANGPIVTVDTQPNGKILIGGAFTSYNSTAINNLARLNPNGSLDTGFNPGSGANGPVYMFSYWGQNQSMIGGGFTTYNGTSRPGIARILTVGNSPTSAINFLLLLN